MGRPHFPRNLLEFQNQFGTEEACLAYLVASRWPDGFRCPSCGGGKAYPLRSRLLWQCAAPNCRHQTSVTAGTVLDGSRTPLMTWFWAAYLMTTDRRGVSASLLQRQLGLGYKTAWLILHKLRRAMLAPERRKLSGSIEMDETWIGGRQSGIKGSRQLKGRQAALVVVAVERTETGSGRTRMEVIPDFTQATMTNFALRNIEKGSTVKTDAMTGFNGLRSAGYTHFSEKQGDIRHGALHVVPMADRAIGNLKQWLLGTYHGVGRSQLQAYLDEFVYRHNRRYNLQAAFQRLLGLGTQHAPATLASVRRDMRVPRLSGYSAMVPPPS
ncbi:MAG: IS1595 family transposase [Candidatus Dormiibacterota bacterium]